MPFINELIPADDHDKLRALAIGAGAAKPQLWKWTVDRARDIFLFRTHELGGPYEGTNVEQHLALGWGADVVSFVAEAENTTATPRNGVLKWHVRNIAMPSSLQKSKEEVQAVIVEALKRRGWLFEPQNPCAVEVLFV